MPVAAIDTQQGFTLTLSVDGLTLRLVNIGEVREVIALIRSTYLASTNQTYLPGELPDIQPVAITWQSGPSQALPSRTPQTITITGALAAGASVAESISGT